MPRVLLLEDDPAIADTVLFALLAAVMTLTRKLDWYALGAGTTPATAPQ